MRIKNINVYDKLMENLYYNLNEINQTKYNIMLEENESIIDEMIIDLKNILIESYQSLKPILSDSQKSYVYENMCNIHRILYNNTNKIENLNKLYESLNSNSKNIYFDNKYSDINNLIIENYISTVQKIINTNNDLYRKELMVISEQVNEDFIDIYNNTVTGLMEGLIGKVTDLLGKIKNGFGNKHDKILNRDKDWLKSNKKKILNLDYSTIELEVINDYNITFEGLLNRHNIFDKHFVNSNNKDNLNDLLRRFEDKKGDIKNGLDNYFRTGNSKREIGMRKVSGDDAKTVVENMINYCENYLAGRKYLDEKIDNITNDLSNTKVEEVTDYSRIFNNSYNPYKVLSLEAADVTFSDEEDNNETIENDDFVDDKMGFEDDENINDEEGMEEKDNLEEVKDNNRGIRDRQVGIAVLLTVAEERYFDYIQVLKGLVE